MILMLIVVVVVVGRKQPRKNTRKPPGYESVTSDSDDDGEDSSPEEEGDCVGDERQQTKAGRCLAENTFQEVVGRSPSSSQVKMLKSDLSRETGQPSWHSRTQAPSPAPHNGNVGGPGIDGTLRRSSACQVHSEVKRLHGLHCKGSEKDMCLVSLGSGTMTLEILAASFNVS